jgi:hypothetical protein
VEAWIAISQEIKRRREVTAAMRIIREALVVAVEDYA